MLVIDPGDRQEKREEKRKAELKKRTLIAVPCMLLSVVLLVILWITKGPNITANVAIVYFNVDLYLIVFYIM